MIQFVECALKTNSIEIEDSKSGSVIECSFERSLHRFSSFLKTFLSQQSLSLEYNLAIRIHFLSIHLLRRRHEGCMLRGYNANVNNECTSSNYETSSSRNLLDRSSIIDRHWRLSFSRCFVARAMTAENQYVNGSASSTEREAWCGWVSLFSRQKQHDVICTSRHFWSLQKPASPSTRFRFRRCAIGRLKAILLQSQNCLHFGDFCSSCIIRDPTTGNNLLTSCKIISNESNIPLHSK